MKKLLIIGGGNMGYAITCGITNKNVYKKQDIVFIEKKAIRIKFLKTKHYLVINNISKAIKKHKYFEAIILAVKPSDIQSVINELKNNINNKTLIISIAAGIKLRKLSSLLSKNHPIARVMPNTPSQVGQGISVITFNNNVSKQHKKIIKKVFQSIGSTIELEENKFDLITAISGSGPAYFCYFIECIINIATNLGLSKNIAPKLVLQTAQGTIDMLSKTNLSPGELRKIVTSPKGTTEAALKVLQRKNLYNIVHSAIKAAKKRATELSKI